MVTQFSEYFAMKSLLIFVTKKECELNAIGN